MPTAPEGGRVAQRIVATRWTPALVASWTPVSDYFLDSYTKLAPPLTNGEAMLVIHLMRHKWDEAPPFPGFKTLARRMGVTATSVRNLARSLEKKGYLRRQKRRGHNEPFRAESAVPGAGEAPGLRGRPARRPAGGGEAAAGRPGPGGCVTLSPAR